MSSAAALLSAVLLILCAVVVWPGSSGVWVPPGEKEKAEGPDPEPGMSTLTDAADAVLLTAVLMRSGMDLCSALENVAEVSVGQVRLDLLSMVAGHRWDVPLEAVFDGLDPQWGPVGVALRASAESGVAPSALLVSVATQLAAAEAERAAARVQRAGVLLTIPLGLLFLPGFVGTTVVPVALHVLASWGR